MPLFPPGGGGGGGVTSVNGDTGPAVVLDAADVGAVALGSSVNGNAQKGENFLPGTAPTDLATVSQLANSAPALKFLFVIDDTETLNLVDTTTGALTATNVTGISGSYPTVTARGNVGIVFDTGSSIATSYTIDSTGLVWTAITTFAQTFTAIYGMCISPDLTTAYMCDFSAGSIYSINITTGATNTSIAGLSNPEGCAVSSDNTVLWVTIGGSTLVPFLLPDLTVGIREVAGSINAAAAGYDTTNVYGNASGALVHEFTPSLVQAQYGGLGNTMFLTVSPDGSTVFVPGNPGAGSILKVDTMTMTSTALSTGAASLAGIACC